MKKLLLLTLFLFTVTCANAAPNKKEKKYHNKHHIVKKYKKKNYAAKQRYRGGIQTNPNVMLMNVTDNHIIENTLPEHRGSIASISKLMTVYTVISAKQEMNEIIPVVSTLSNHTRLSKGMQVSRKDLIMLALIHSDNLAAKTLADNYIGGYDAFIHAMNKNAKELLMDNTMFYDPTGLHAGNVSSTKDIIFLTNAVSQFSIVREAAQSEDYKVKVTKGKKTFTIIAKPTINFFGKEGVITLKTVFTNAACFCITMLVNKKDKLYNIVILGARSSQERKFLIERSLKSIQI
jgi:D-alanyl-D-alanine endopeptidase (penicillin-binding protein 7)